MSSIVSGRGVYKLSNKALVDHPEIVEIQSKGHKKMLELVLLKN